MTNKYFTWEAFTNNFGKEIEVADSVYQHMKQNGLIDFAYTVFDFQFESDSESKVNDLANLLHEHYPYTGIKVMQEGQMWMLTGDTDKIPVTDDILVYWVLDMYKRGFECDCKLVSYGAIPGDDIEALPAMDNSMYGVHFKQGIECYHSGNLSGALINWTLAIQSNPKDANAYYSRAIVKDEFYTWKSALSDYDKAIELAPDFISAYTNRGAVRDDNGDHLGAIEDYNKVIELAKNDIVNLQMAYFNRGNAKQNLQDINGACADWHKALEFGADYAEEKINLFCK